MSEKRTLTEIALAHAEIVDAMWEILYPANFSKNAAYNIAHERGGEYYFTKWANSFDLPLLQSAIQNNGGRDY